jgi:hypothetical protein
MAVAMLWIASIASPLVYAIDNGEQASLFDGSVAVQDLDAQRGGADTRVTTISTSNDSHGFVDHNSATNVTTGENVISTGAFANMQGMPMTIQNSGNNVLIQSSTVMTVEIK